MDLNEYQTKAAEFAVFPKTLGLIYPVLGLVGEAGEVAEKLKKIIRDNEGWMSEEQKHEFAKEVGDVLWYIAAIASGLGYTLSDIADMNLGKLQSRKSRNVLNGSGDNR